MKKKYTANEVHAALDQCLDLITTQEADRLSQWTQTPVVKGVADGRSQDSFLFYLDDKAIDRRFKKPTLKPKALFFDFAIIEAGCNGLLYPKHKFTLAYDIRRDAVYSPFDKTQQSKYYVEYYLIHTPTFQRIEL